MVHGPLTRDPYSGPTRPDSFSLALRIGAATARRIAILDQLDRMTTPRTSTSSAQDDEIRLQRDVSPILDCYFLTSPAER